MRGHQTAVPATKLYMYKPPVSRHLLLAEGGTFQELNLNLTLVDRPPETWLKQQFPLHLYYASVDLLACKAQPP